MILWLTRVTNENLHKIDRHEDNAEEISLAWDWPWENDQLIANKRDAKIDPGEKKGGIRIVQKQHMEANS